MARHTYRGDAVATPDIVRADLKSVIPGGRYGIRFWNGPIASVVASAGDLLSDLTTRLMEAVKSLSVNAYGNSGNSFIIEGVPGESLGPEVDSSPGCYVEVLRAGVATTPQVIRIVMPVGANGGTWLLSIGGTGVFTCSTYNMAYNATETTLKTEIEFALNEYGGLDGTGVGVTLVNPGSSTASRIYEVTMGGAFSGLNFNFSPNGDALQGVGSVTCTPVQLAAASATCIQVITIPLLPNPTNGRQQAIKFSRDGVTSGEVSCEFTSVSTFQANVDAALASVLGANKVQTTIGYYTEKLNTSGGTIAIAIRWMDLGTQTSMSAVYYNKQPNTYPGPNSPLNGTTTLIRQSGANQNEFVLAPVVVSNPNGGASTQSYDITMDSTTWSIDHSYTTTTSQLVTQWEEGVGAGNVNVHSISVPKNNIYVVEFKGAKANLDQPLPTFNTPNGRAFHVISEGEPLQNQIDQVVVRWAGGSFTASSDGTNYTSALSFGLTASTFQTSLRALTAIGSGNCNVTGSGTPADPFRIEYVGAKATTTMPQLVFNTSNLLGGAHPEIVIVTAANPGVRQYDKIYIDANAVSGTVTPIVGGIVGKAVAYNGNAGAWETGIEGSGVGVSVTGAVGGPFFVEYDTAGPRNLTLEQSLLVTSESTLVTLTQLQEATGPLHYNAPANWSTGVVPGSDDTLVFVDSSASIQEGLRQRCTFTADIPTGDFRLGTSRRDCGDFAVGQKVRIATTGTFPTATINGVSHTLSASTEYYVIAIDRFNRRMQLATTRSGVGIELTGAGTGVHTVTVRWAKIEQRRSHSGRIGRSRRDGDKWEVRPRYLKGEAALVEIGIGESGSGTSLCFLDLGTFPFTCYVWESGNGRQGEQAIQIQCSNTLNDFYLRGGQIGIGTDEEPCVIGDVVGQSANITLGLVSLSTLDLTGGVHTFPQGITASGSVRII